MIVIIPQHSQERDFTRGPGSEIHPKFTRRIMIFKDYKEITNLESGGVVDCASGPSPGYEGLRIGDRQLVGVCL